ncbi:MAG: hypothetical protein ABI658_24195 [Acidimicrobiales bacterium]
MQLAEWFEHNDLTPHVLDVGMDTSRAQGTRTSKFGVQAVGRGTRAHFVANHAGGLHDSI